MEFGGEALPPFMLKKNPECCRGGAAALPLAKLYFFSLDETCA